MKRIDALVGMGRSRLLGLTGKALDAALDDTLQAIVGEVAQELTVPIALVSLVLERTQFFRAYVGLPHDLAVARATDRDLSFCQFVVRDGCQFEVNDAISDERVPQALVDQYGVRAYLGEPVSVAGQVVGSLCGIDTKPRLFSDTDRARLGLFATRVGERLTQLAAELRMPPVGAVSVAAAPAFAEARNLLAPLTGNLGAARVALADLGPLVRLAHELSQCPPEGVPALASLTDAFAAFEDLGGIVGDLESCSAQLSKTVLALEKLVLPARHLVAMPEIVEAASLLAHHHTKLVGSVSWGDVPYEHVVAPRAVVVSALAAALSLLADAQKKSQSEGLRGTVCRVGGEVHVDLWGAAVSPAGIVEVAGSLERLLGDDNWVVVAAHDGALRLSLPASPGPS